MVSKELKRLQKTSRVVEPETETVKVNKKADSVSHNRSLTEKTRLKTGSLKEIHVIKDKFSDKMDHRNNLQGCKDTLRIFSSPKTEYNNAMYL